jgi:pimeloyl-ACP methyl ester carboxylesterase
LVPQQWGTRLYFVSNLGQGGHLSLYAMEAGGSVPEPLLPPHIALQNPSLLESDVFTVFPSLGKILVILDQDGDENYQPMLIPLEGGLPEPAFGDRFVGYRVRCLKSDPARNLAYLHAESSQTSQHEAYQANLESGTLLKLGESTWENSVMGFNARHTRVTLLDVYGAGDDVLYEWRAEGQERHLLLGTPIEQRVPDQVIPPHGIRSTCYTPGDTGLLICTTIFADTASPGYLDLADPADLQPVTITGTAHTGVGELESIHAVRDTRYRLTYNIDGCSWLYEGSFDEAARAIHLDTILCGYRAPLADGVLEGAHYTEQDDCYALSFSTATSPSQLYTMAGPNRQRITQHTRERILGVPQDCLATGEDASFTSFDGERISARLYLPSERLGFAAPRPLVYYVHGGPQGQERPDFTWFSMPLIQFLTLNGFAVFVPNVRGSTGYGLRYTRQVERDWGGQDRLDHVHAMTVVLPRDKRVDVTRAGVIGRSYGGFMTLTLASRHPELWSAAVDLFGPYDLLQFTDHVPDSWKPLLPRWIGDPVADRALLIERSPSTSMHQLRCPLLVIQGQHDPRVVEQDSRAIVEHLRSLDKQVEYLVFSDEGHDVLKFANRVRCYNAIEQFFQQHLGS